ncbi:translation initiation factor IF-2-like [Pteropus medius]|uniref:translation initiation factor IF-2-like n=1 Tax=Pteropus vampyrus TaxID=132908 RepID=UPI00196A48E3|nr:translation initiation factor IF-2-like [Pteropus giganteus]
MEEISPGAQRPTKLLHTGDLGRHPPDHTGSLPQPPTSDRAPGAPIAAAAAAACPLAWPGFCLALPPAPPRPGPTVQPDSCPGSANALHASQLARLLPGGCPARGSRLRTRLGRPGYWLANAPGFRAGSGCRAQRGRVAGENSRQLQLPEPELQLQPRARPPPSASACEVNLPPRTPLSMPSGAVGEPERPGREQRAAAGGRGPAPGSRAPGSGFGGKALGQGGDPGAKSQGETMCGRQYNFHWLWKVCGLESKEILSAHCGLGRHWKGFTKIQSAIKVLQLLRKMGFLTEQSYR